METCKNIDKIIEVFSNLNESWKKHLIRGKDEFYNLDIGELPKHALAIQYTNIAHVMNITPFLIKMEIELRSHPNKINEVVKVFDVIINTYNDLELEIKLFQSKGFPFWSSEMYGVHYEPGTNLFDDIIIQVKSLKGKYNSNSKSFNSASDKKTKAKELSDLLKPEHSGLVDIIQIEFNDKPALQMFNMLIALEEMGYLRDSALTRNKKDVYRALKTSLGFSDTYEALVRHFNNRKKPDEFEKLSIKEKIQNLINTSKVQ